MELGENGKNGKHARKCAVVDVNLNIGNVTAQRQKMEETGVLEIEHWKETVIFRNVQVQ